MISQIIKRGYNFVASITPLKPYAPKPLDYQRVLVLGNSITRHPPLPEIGWPNDWGMAATAREKDFVHLLRRRFMRARAQMQLVFENIAVWENTYWEYDLNQLAFAREFAPELLILRIGENVAGDTVDTHHFATHFSRLLDYLHQPGTRILVVGSFWAGNPATGIMRWVSKAHGVSFISLEKIGSDMSNRAIGQHENGGVANHPNDKGMANIAKIIWDNR
jgi:hypothetical protein